jgi:hypothetical protein
MELTQEIFDKNVHEIATKKLFYHTVQLLEKGGAYGYKPFGSGVLVEINSKYLVFTASHVTAVTSEINLYINTPKGFLIVRGGSRETDLEKDKHTDVAYIILDEEVGKLLAESYTFLPISKIRGDHSLLRILQYVVAGYPVKNIKTEGKTVYAGMSFYLLQGSKDEAYAFHKKEKEKNYLLDFAGKGINLNNQGKEKVDPEPYGLSGCGLWQILPSFIHGKWEFDYKLIGIMTEFKKSKYHVLVGNNVGFIMQALQSFEGFQFVRKSK